MVEAKKAGIRIIGPNCLGVMVPPTGVNATFASGMARSGSVAFLSQSGALCTAVLDYAQAKHIGFSKFVSFGNKADLNEVDFLQALIDDKDTKN